MALAIVPFFAYSQSVQREGDTYVEQPSQKKRTAQEPMATSRKYKTKDGKIYTIYLSSNGNAFIYVVSKNGNTYKKYLPEVTKQLKAEGVKYNGKN